MSIFSVLRTLEKLTRPPKLGHDMDVPTGAVCNGDVCAASDCPGLYVDITKADAKARALAADMLAADALADREAEEEVGIGTGLDGIDENLTKFIKQTIGPMTCCGELWVHAGNCPAKTSGSYGIKVEDGQPYVIGRDVTLGELHKCTEPTCCCQDDDRYVSPFAKAGREIRDIEPVEPHYTKRTVAVEIKDAAEPITRMLDDDGAPIHLPESTLDDVVAQLAQLTYFAEDIRNLISSSPPWGGHPGDETAAVHPPAASPAEVDEPPTASASAGHFSEGVEAAATIIGAAAQAEWRKMLDAHVLYPTVDHMSVCRLLDGLTQQLRDHAAEYAHNK